MNIKLSKKVNPPKGYESWKVEYSNELASFDPSKLALHLESEQKTSYIKGEVLAERMKDKGLNANVLYYLLEHTELIPEDWKGKYVYFFGTILQGSGGSRYVLCLCWRDGGWDWDCRWLGSGWGAGDPSAFLATSTPSLDIDCTLDTLRFALPKTIIIEGVKYKRDTTTITKTDVIKVSYIYAKTE